MDSKKHKLVPQFVKSVEDFSSQYGFEAGTSYLVRNLAGPPNNYPNYGDFTSACVFRYYGLWWSRCPSTMRPVASSLTPPTAPTLDYVTLGLEVPVVVDQVVLYETYHPGALTRILALYRSPANRQTNKKSASDCKKSENCLRWVTLWRSSGKLEDRPDNLPPKSRMFKPYLQVRPNEATSIIRLEFDSSLCAYYTELDAVEVIGYRDDYLLSGPRGVCLSTLNTEATQITRSADNINKDAEQMVKLLSVTEMLSIDDIRLSDNCGFDILPTELLLKIFSYLDLKDVMRLASVSRLFYSISEETIASLEELNLRSFWPTLTNSALESLYSRMHCGRRLTRLDVSWSGNYGQISSAGLGFFLENCGSRLTTLVLSSCRFVDDECLVYIADHCQFLQELDLSSCVNIKSDGFRHLSRLPCISRLQLYRTVIEDDALLAVLSFAPNLQHLCLGSCNKIRYYDEIAKCIGQFCKNLISLDLWRARSLSSVGLEYIANNCFQLEELDIGWCPEVCTTTNCLSTLVRNCTRLRKLFLTANRSVCNRDLVEICHHLPGLEQLDLLGTNCIQPETVHLLLKSCPHLCMLDVSFCKEILLTHIDTWKVSFPHCSILQSYQNLMDFSTRRPNQHIRHVGPNAIVRIDP